MCGLACLRLTGAFPKGLGKGHDTAVVCKWLEHEVGSMDISKIDAHLHVIFQLCADLKGRPMQVVLRVCLAHVSPKDSKFHNVIEVLRWTCKATNEFYRILFANGVWLSRADAQVHG